MKYGPRWKDYKRRFAVTLGIWVGFPLVMVILGVEKVTFISLVVAWLSAFAVAMVWLFSWRCPRCGDYFFIKMPFNHPLAKKCVHCGLPKWAKDDPDKDDFDPSL